MAYSKIRPRRGTLYEWASVNPVIDEGEMVIENPESGVGTGLCRAKIGDGFTKYQDLPYALDGTAASAIYGGNATVFNPICLRSATTEEWLSVDPVLLYGELTYDFTANAFKVGNGVSTWSQLKYAGGLTPTETIDLGDEDEDLDFGDMDVEDVEPNPTVYDYGDEDEEA